MLVDETEHDCGAHREGEGANCGHSDEDLEGEFVGIGDAIRVL